MFGQNQIVGTSFFRLGAPSPLALLVTSMFWTLQGEGPFRGHPAFFTRLAMCNLACSFCDTFFDKGDWLTPHQIRARTEERIHEFFNGEVPAWAHAQFGQRRKAVFVITGGEPMLQSNIGDLCRLMLHEFENVQIESNGTLLQDLPEAVTLVCSPKCAEKDGRATRYLRPLQRVLDRANCLKFVMCADREEPYSQVPDWAHAWAAETGRQVFVSPMNVYNDLPQKAKQLRAERQGAEITMEERSTVDEVVSFWEPGLLNMQANQANHEHAARYAISHGFIFNVQTHLLASLA